MIEQVYQRLLEVITENVPVQSEMATVKAVDKDKLECTVVPLTNDELEIEGVNLKAVIDGTQNGLVQIPKIGSIVLISLIENTDGDHYVSMYSDIEEVLFVQNNNEILKIDTNGNLLLHQGLNLGMVKIVSLVEKLNAVEEKLNALIDDYKGHDHKYTDDGAPSVTTGLAAIPNLDNLTKTLVADLENDKVKH
ncbi:MAG: hypothetical protein AAFX87_02780 [Bacteroidota bacterium]